MQSIPGFYYDEETNRYYKLTAELREKLKNKVTKTEPIIPNILMKTNVQEYLKDRKLNKIAFRLQREIKEVHDFVDKVHQWIAMNEIIVYASGSRLMALRGCECILLHTDTSNIINIERISDSIFVFATLGGSKPGSIHKCTLLNCKLIFIKSCMLRKGSIYSFGFKKFAVIFSEKSIFIYTLQLKYNRRININSDVLHCCYYNDGMILSCRNGNILYFNLQTFQFRNIFKCSSAADLINSNNTIYACTDKFLYKFTNFDQIHSYETSLDKMFLSSDLLIETNAVSTIIKSLYTMEITHIFNVPCYQFLSASDGHIFNNAYNMW